MHVDEVSQLRGSPNTARRKDAQNHLGWWPPSLCSPCTIMYSFHPTLLYAQLISIDNCNNHLVDNSKHVLTAHPSVSDQLQLQSDVSPQKMA